MADFHIALSDATRVSNCLLWNGVVRADDEATARELVRDRIEQRVCAEIGLPQELVRWNVIEVVPFLTPDFVQTA